MLMLVEIEGYSFDHGEVTIYGVDCSEWNLQRLERMRDDRESELVFVFTGDDINDLYIFLKKLNCTRGCTTIGQAVAATVGIRTHISSKFRVWE